MTALFLNEAFVRVLFVVAAVGTPVAAAALYAWKRARRSSSPPSNVIVAIMVSGPAIGLLWLIYNRVVSVFDLDSLAGLGANTLIFTAAGVAAGLVWRRWNGVRR